MAKKVSIGILGAAKIVPRAIIAPAKKLEDVQVYGIAARDKARAEEFAGKYSIPHIFSDYESIVKCNEIDAIYIPLPNAFHADWAIKSAQAEKHILLEKPSCLRLEEFDAVENAVKKHGVHLLEAIMVQHHPWQKKVKEIIDKEVYGQLKVIKTRITFQVEKNNTNKDSYSFFPERGGGVFFDVGTYWVQFVNDCIGLQPDSIRAKSLFNGPNGIDSVFEAWMNFPNGVHTEFFCSFEHPLEANHWLEFEKARMRIRNFFRPAFGDFMLNIDIHNHKTNRREKITFPPKNYYYDQLEFFIKVIQGKTLNFPLSKSRNIVKTMQDIYDYAKTHH